MNTGPIKNKISLAAMIAISVILSGCSAFVSDLSTWEGHPASELIDSWGEPDRTRSLSSDTTAMTWIKENSACEYTFIVREDLITGLSETEC